MLPNTVWTRRLGLIDMNPCCRLSRTGAAYVGRAFNALANGMVEDEDAIRLQCRPDEGLRCWIVDGPHFPIVMEVLNRGRVPNQGKPLAIQRDTAGDQTRIEDGNLVRFGQRRGLPLSRRRIEGIGSWFARGRSEIVELSRHEGKRFDFSFLKAHGKSPEHRCLISSRARCFSRQGAASK